MAKCCDWHDLIKKPVCVIEFMVSALRMQVFQNDVADDN